MQVEEEISRTKKKNSRTEHQTGDEKCLHEILVVGLVTNWLVIPWVSLFSSAKMKIISSALILSSWQSVVIQTQRPPQVCSRRTEGYSSGTDHSWFWSLCSRLKLSPNHPPKSFGKVLNWRLRISHSSNTPCFPSSVQTDCFFLPWAQKKLLTCFYGTCGRKNMNI